MSKTDKFIEHINKHILPFIDYDRLQQSYETDMKYAKGVLNKLHTAMATVYETERFGRDYAGSEEGLVVVPGVLWNRESGKLSLGLFDIDLESSGEHWGTGILCKYGVISQDDCFTNEDDNIRAKAKEIMKELSPYEHVYTATIPHDIHIDKSKLPKEIQDILDDFHNHSIDLLEGESETEEEFGDGCC
jgi:hypothetical protein